MTIEFFKQDLDRKYVRTHAIERFVFPAGEQHIKIHGDRTGNQLAVVKGADANDLLALQMWAEAVRDDRGVPRAIVAYLPGARADREMPRGATYYAGLINGAGLEQVICFDPHSPYMPSLINNSTAVSAYPLVQRFLSDHAIKISGVVIPDEGATERAGRLADALSVPTFQAKKKRDPQTGKLSGFTCEPITIDGVLLVSDDICDGGGTFKGLAAATGLPRERLALWVSHGVFSPGAAELAHHYSLIATTDSLPPSPHSPSNYTIPLFDYLTGFLRS